MKTTKYLTLLKFALLTSAAPLALQVHAEAREHNKSLQLATGQYITPTFVRGAVQQYLNPGLTAYPNFVAGEAVRSQLSPDGTTLAVICAGHNSLDKPDGTVDTANSTQYIFIYNVASLLHLAMPVAPQSDAARHSLSDIGCECQRVIAPQHGNHEVKRRNREPGFVGHVSNIQSRSARPIEQPDPVSHADIEHRQWRQFNLIIVGHDARRH